MHYATRPVSPFFPLRLTLVSLAGALWLYVGGCTSSDQSAVDDLNSGVITADQVDPGWPVAVDAPQGRIVVYQPQPESLDGNQLKGRAALSLTPAGGQAKFGVAWFTARLTTDRDTRTATLDNIHTTLVRLTGVTAADQQQLANAVAEQLSQMSVNYSLDQLTASLDAMTQRRAEKSQLSTTPPHIIFSTTPATLVSVDGEPRLTPMPSQPGMSRVANTPFILLHNDADQHFYLKEGNLWASAPALEGPWAQSVTPPDAVKTAGDSLSAPPATQPAANTVMSPATQPAADLAAEVARSQILVSTSPAELIVTDGDPKFSPIPGGQLLYASNTSANLFLDAASRQYYVLLAGRWFTAPALAGPWQFVAADHLPAAFNDIPADSPKASVLTFVGGTVQARDALLDAAVPQTAAIRRDVGQNLTVDYDGSPQFKPIPECAGLSYAVNTPAAVLTYQGVYYCCHQAVWYQATTPTGPWTLCAAVPDIIYTIPPSSPLYNVTFVRIYNAEPDVVYEGYTPGYVGNYVYGPTVVYGTGYDYPGWYGTDYFPEPVTWGFDPEYDPYAAIWGFDWGVGLGFYGYDGWFAQPWGEGWWRDHPHSRWGSHRWWGPGGYMNYQDVHRHIAEAGGFGRDHFGGRPGDLSPHLPGRSFSEPGWHNLYARQGNAFRNADLSHQSFHSPGVMYGQRNDVFAGTRGDIYQRTGNGWMARGSDGGTWSAYHGVPEAGAGFRADDFRSRADGAFGRDDAGMERDFAAREHGFGRASTFHGMGGGFHGGGFGGGGFHGGGFGGGGFHGGGGRR